LGGTAVGTGFGAHPDFAPKVCGMLSDETGLDYRPAAQAFEALSSRSACAELAGCLSATATSMVRIADDIRLLASGPRLGLGEIKIPALQPGSSIMPGKVNPVMPEMVAQVGTQVTANSTAVTIASQAGHLELSTMLPVIAANLLESIDIMSNAASVFAGRCVAGIEADEERCSFEMERNLALATALAQKIGYAKACSVAKTAAATGRTVRQTALDMEIADEEELEALLDADNLTRAHRP